jgi:hypothetical protein
MKRRAFIVALGGAATWSNHPHTLRIIGRLRSRVRAEVTKKHHRWVIASERSFSIAR